MKREEPLIDIFLRYEKKPVRILLGLYKGNYLLLLLSGLFYLIKHSPAWVMPIVTAQIITAITDGGTAAWDLVLQNAIVLAGLVVLNVPMNYLHVHCRSKALRRVEVKLRSAIVEKLQQLSIPYHNEMQSGKLQSKVIRDVEAVQTLSEQLFVNLLNISINISVSLAITASTNLTIFLFFLITIPVASLTIKLFRKPIEQKNRSFRQEMEKTSANFVEMEDMIAVTRAHALEDVEMEKMRRQAQQVANEGYHLDIIQANFGSISWAVFQFFQILTLVFSSKLSLDGQLPVGNVVLYQSYFTTLVNQVTGLITLIPMIAKGLESVRSVGEVLTSLDVEDYRGKRVLAQVQGSFCFEHASFRYQDHSKMVLDNFSLKVNPGETIALVGESGAGKSTLINLIIGFIKLSDGQYVIDGVDSKDLDFRSFRRQLSVVPQNTILFSGTIRDNISYGNPSISDNEILQAIESASLTSFLAEQEQGLDTMITENGGNLSGGQRQRLSIARALIRKPKVIIFDEATSALDSVSENVVMEALDRLIEGRTAFIVAHRISTIRKADRIILMQGGHIAEMGTYEELMALKGDFYTMQQLQAGKADDYE